jgi:soluble lytic murein transglycosylase-like protein
MKLSGIALFLGCTGLLCGYAVQSDFLLLRSNLIHFGILPGSAAPPAPQNLQLVKISAQPPLLTKAETMLLIKESAAKHNVPSAFVASIVAAESNFDCAAVSPKGAIGLMQLMPETAQQFGADPAIPAENIDAGTRYLRWLMDRYQRTRNSITHVIAAYNAGPGMVDRYRGIPPFRETRCYVKRVMAYMKEFSRPENTMTAEIVRLRPEADQAD